MGYFLASAREVLRGRLSSERSLSDTKLRKDSKFSTSGTFSSSCPFSMSGIFAPAVRPHSLEQSPSVVQCKLFH